jgi:hypothetical protein
MGLEDRDSIASGATLASEGWGLKGSD